jgi:DNA-3-methyladenine glycosylase I
VIGVQAGPDGRPRCSWALSAPEYLDYHDNEWGRPVTDVAGLYERLTLEAFQSGLSWITILRKRVAFRNAFAGFDPYAVARFDENDVDRLLTDPGIVRNRAKIEAAIRNARVVAELGEAFPPMILGYAVTGRPRPTADEARATSPESVAMARDLKRAGFRFVGPTTAYALMQAIGLVDDHLQGCFVPPGQRASNASSLA